MKNIDTRDILTRLTKVKAQGDGWQACCPSHEDKNASLHVSIGNDGRTLLTCFAGCRTEDIVNAMNLETKDLFIKDDRNNFEIKKPTQKNFVKPKVESRELSQAAIDYMAKRKISLETLNTMQVEEKDKAYVFKYYDLENELVFVKYRPIGKIQGNQLKSWREKGGKAILWGMNRIDKTKPLVICEGELDQLAIIEAGYENVVSVPSGASDMSWIELCYDWLAEFEKIVLFGDNDPPGQKMVREIIIRLGEWRCYIANHEHKDANEVLYFQGAAEVLRVIKEAQPVPKVGIVDVADIEPNIKVDSGGIPTGIRSLDRLFEDMGFGELTIWTGKNGEGKSTLLGQVLLEALEVGESVFAYSGELTKERFQVWINTQAAGLSNLDKHTNKYGDEIYTVKKHINDQIREWYRGKFFLFDNGIRGKNIENTGLLDLCEYAAMKYGCKLFVIDNLMTADYDVQGDNLYQAQSRFVGDLVHFSKAFNVHTHLVAHPKKTDKGRLEKESISGTGDITNRADNVIAIERVPDEKKSKMECDAVLSVLKNRENGKLGDIKLNFNVKERRFSEVNITTKKTYGWERVNVVKTALQEVLPWD